VSSALPIYSSSFDRPSSLAYTLSSRRGHHRPPKSTGAVAGTPLLLHHRSASPMIDFPSEPSVAPPCLPCSPRSTRPRRKNLQMPKAPARRRRPRRRGHPEHDDCAAWAGWAELWPWLVPRREAMGWIRAMHYSIFFSFSNFPYGLKIVEICINFLKCLENEIKLKKYEINFSRILVNRSLQ
jgi:hypothetical protein